MNGFNLLGRLVLVFATWSVANHAAAFCFTSDLLSSDRVLVEQVDENILERYNPRWSSCIRMRSAECAGTYLWNEISDSADAFWKDLSSSGMFRKMLWADNTQCCSWRNGDCNPYGGEDSRVVFKVQQMQSKPTTKEFMGISYMGESDYVVWSEILTMGAQDHAVCTANHWDRSKTNCRVAPRGGGAFVNENRKGAGNLRSADSRRCLDIQGANQENGAALVIWDCHDWANQQWTVHRNGLVRSSLNNKCLDVRGGSTEPGAEVVMWSCHGGLNQQWYYRFDGILMNMKSKLCLDVQGGHDANGSRLHQWKCGVDQPNQLWSMN